MRICLLCILLKTCMVICRLNRYRLSQTLTVCSLNTGMTHGSFSWHNANYFFICFHVLTFSQRYFSHFGTVSDWDFMYTGIILAFSEGQKFCDIFRISGSSSCSDFGFPYAFFTFSLLPQLKIGRSQPVQGDFSPKLSSRMTLGIARYCH